jgi:hypothetical protein
MSWAYRCNKCRGRNTIKHKYEWYKKAPSCRHCGHAEFIPPEGSIKKAVIGPVFYLDKARQYRKDICRDTSCCHYPHRYASTLCIHHPQHEIIVRTGRYGEALEDVLADIARREKEEIEAKNGNEAQDAAAPEVDPEIEVAKG